MFNNSLYSDVIIKIFDVEIPAHQFVICVQSEYFKKAFQKPQSLKEGDAISQGFAEGESMIIEFKEGSGAAYWRVLEYLYTGDYAEQLSTGVFRDDPDFVKHVRVFSLADMFLIEDLKVLAENKLENALKSFQISKLFADCVRDVYDVTEKNGKMRNIVTNASVTKLTALGKKQYGNSYQYTIPIMLEYEYMQELIRDCGDFAVDFAITFCRAFMR
ncbi:hypothetical protein K3495_g6550 [Podosphaera aphanis]|nr:hypothetical protein K3495_g6550 [Podosphaera aphanis]